MQDGRVRPVRGAHALGKCSLGLKKGFQKRWWGMVSKLTSGSTGEGFQPSYDLKA
jgi:hypothetical protein